MDWMVNRGRLAAVVVGGLWLVAAVAAAAVAVAAAAPACTARKASSICACWTRVAWISHTTAREARGYGTCRDPYMYMYM